MAYGKRIVKRHRLTDQKKEAFLLKSGLIVLVLLLLLFSSIYLSRMDFSKISDINLEGNSITSSRSILEIINRNISGYYFKMFPRKNILLYPKNKIKNDLMNEFQRIEEVDLFVKDFEKLQVVIKERRPDIIWCGEERVAARGGDAEKCYFIDSNGLIYSKAPNFSGNVFLRAYGEIGDLEPIGREFMPVSKYQSLKLFQGAVEGLGLMPTAVVRLPENDMEMYLKEGGKLIYNLNQDALQLSEDLGSILKDSELKKEIENKNSALDYIDLRLGNKVYYRFK